MPINNIKERTAVYLWSCGEELIRRADDIASTAGDYSDLDVWISLNPHETPEMKIEITNVPKGIVDHWVGVLNKNNTDEIRFPAPKVH